MIKELKEKRRVLVADMFDISKQAEKNDNGRMTAEQDERWQKLEADEAAITEEIRKAEKLAQLEAEMAEKKAEEPKKENAEERRLKAFRNYLITGDAKQYRDTQDGQSVATDADGGYTVPTSWAQQIARATLAYGGVESVATVINTSGGGQLNWPTVNDTSNSSSIVAEETISTESKVTFGTKALNAYTLRTSIIPISIELLQDSAYDMEGTIISLLAEQDARGANAYFTTGTGESQPNGVVTAATAGKTAAADDAITRSEIVDLIHSLDPSYRMNAKFMFHDVVLKAIKKLTVGTSDDRPLWQPGIAFGDPDTIDGYEYVINQQMASAIEASAVTILFGDFSNYVIRRVQGYSLVRFNEFYMRSLQIGLMGYSRIDGELINAGTNPVKKLTQAAS